MARCPCPRRHRLQRLFSSFPEGWPGIGLILLRLTVALNAIFQGMATLMVSNGPAFTPWFSGLLAITVGLALLIGFLTPLAGAAAAIGYLVRGVSSLLATDVSQHSAAFVAFGLGAISIALVLLGPGAFSLDGYLFGRRKIIIPEGRRPPGHTSDS